MTSLPSSVEEAFIEQGAAIEHTRWANWQKYLHSLCEKNPDGSLTIPAWQVERAERQIATDYSVLSEQEKESDRREVRSYLPLLAETARLIAEAARREGVVEGLEKGLVALKEKCPNDTCENGVIPFMGRHGPEPTPCRWCYEITETIDTAITEANEYAEADQAEARNALSDRPGGLQDND